MAKSKTPAKRARQAEDSRLRNKVYKTKLKTAMKNFELAVEEKNIEVAKEAMLKASSIVDASTTKGVLHKNTAARKKSAIAKKLNSVLQ